MRLKILLNSESEGKKCKQSYRDSEIKNFLIKDFN